MDLLGNGFQGVFGGIVVLALGWSYASVRRRRKMKASEADHEQAKDSSDRALLEAVYGAMITADPTPLNPSPTPGLVDQVQDIQGRIAEVKTEQQNVAQNLAEHRTAVSDALTADQHEVKTLLEQHITHDERSFDQIINAISELKQVGPDK